MYQLLIFSSNYVLNVSKSFSNVSMSWGFHWNYKLLKVCFFFCCFARVEKKGVVEFRHNPDIWGQNERCSKFMVLWWPKAGRA